MLGGKASPLPRLLVLSLSAAIVVLAGSAGAQVPATPWIDQLNLYRGVTAVSPVIENEALTQGATAHANYVVINDLISFDEDPGAVGYTEEGDAAAPATVQLASQSVVLSEEMVIERFVTSAFYGPLVLNPEMLETGLGVASDAQSRNVKSAAALDIDRGVIDDPTYARYPVSWPGDGSTVALTTAYPNEQPNPLTSCPGYVAPVGLPISLQLKQRPDVTHHEILEDGVPLEHSAFDEGSYSNPELGLQQFGRYLLRERRSYVMIPIRPLKVGSVYTVTVTNSGVTYEWSFSVGDVTTPSTRSIAGSNSSDDISGTVDDDVIFAVNGDDTVEAGAGGDVIYGARGKDFLLGQDAKDFVFGGTQDDRLSGGAQKDRLVGGQGDDRLDGGTGADIIDGGAGRDVCIVDESDTVKGCEVVKKKRSN